MQTTVTDTGNTRTAKVMEGLRYTGAARQLMAMEASVAWPIPYRANNRAYLILPTYTVAPMKDGQFAIFPWASAFTLDWLTETLVEYVDFRFKSAWSTIDFGRPLGNLRPVTAEMATQANRLCGLYDEMLNSIALNDTPPPFWFGWFKEKLNALVQPLHKDFYRQLAPKFYERYLG